MRLVVLPLAARDLEDAAAFYEMQQEGLGLRFLTEARFVAFEAIRSTPRAFQAMRRGGSVRRFVFEVFPFVAYYEIDGDEIAILAILHARRRMDLVVRKRRRTPRG